jgi:hypothetical protein
MARIRIEPKYEVDSETGVVHNRVSGKAIPADEPLILFRAQDANLPYALCRYMMLTSNLEHRRAVALRLAEVCAWQAEHPELVKQPDTTVDAGWPTIFPPDRSRLG